MYLCELHGWLSNEYECPQCIKAVTFIKNPNRIKLAIGFSNKEGVVNKVIAVAEINNANTIRVIQCYFKHAKAEVFEEDSFWESVRNNHYTSDWYWFDSFIVCIWRVKNK